MPFFIIFFLLGFDFYRSFIGELLLGYMDNPPFWKNATIVEIPITFLLKPDDH